MRAGNSLMTWHLQMMKKFWKKLEPLNILTRKYHVHGLSHLLETVNKEQCGIYLMHSNIPECYQESLKETKSYILFYLQKVKDIK